MSLFEEDNMSAHLLASQLICLSLTWGNLLRNDLQSFKRVESDLFEPEFEPSSTSIFASSSTSWNCNPWLIASNNPSLKAYNLAITLVTTFLDLENPSKTSYMLI